MMDQPWGNGSHQQLKIERIPHCFETLLDDEDSGFSRKKTARDPLSHRIIEKRRRDRMNSCLADLSKLIPSTYLKKARGRIEKTEIIEMAIRHLKHLQAHACRESEKCDLALKLEYGSNVPNQFHCGYQECMNETMHFLVEKEGFYATDDICVRLLSHLQKHCDKLIQGCDKLQNRKNSTVNKNNVSSTVSENSKEDAISSRFTHPSRNQNGNTPVKRHQTICSEGNSSKFFTELAERTLPFTQEDNRPSDDERDCKFHSDMEVSNHEDQKTLQVLWFNEDVIYKNEINKTKEFSHTNSEADEQFQNQELRYFSPVTQEQLLKSRPVSVNSSASSSRSEEVYKFKTNIKQRFTADLQQNHHVPTSSHEMDMENGNDNVIIDECNQIAEQNGKSLHYVASIPPLINVNTCMWKANPRTDNDETMKSPNPPTCFSEIAAEKVPIFVLHPKGTFYLPMTIDTKIVSDFIKFTDSTPVLHPVSITVYFGNILLPESASKALPHISSFSLKKTS